MNYYYKYQKYKNKYIYLKNKLEYNGGKIDSYLGMTLTEKYPRHIFSNNITENIYKWNDLSQKFDIIFDTNIYLSSYSICNIIPKKKITINDCKIKSKKIFDMISTLPSDNFIICINYTNIQKDKTGTGTDIILKDFQIGITESSNNNLVNNESSIECARRGIIEEIGLHFTNDSLSHGEIKETYDETIACFINKLSDLEFNNINKTSNLQLNGGIITTDTVLPVTVSNTVSDTISDTISDTVSNTVSDTVLPVTAKTTTTTTNLAITIFHPVIHVNTTTTTTTNPTMTVATGTSDDIGTSISSAATRKSHIFLYDTIENINIILKKRYIENLTLDHYKINELLTINGKILKKTNDEKNNIEIYIVSIFELKNMLLNIYNAS